MLKLVQNVLLASASLDLSIVALTRPLVRTSRSTPLSALHRRSTIPLSLARRRSHKREIDLNRLIKKLCIMRTIYRSSSLVESWILDQCITLLQSACDNKSVYALNLL